MPDVVTNCDDCVEKADSGGWKAKLEGAAGVIKKVKEFPCEEGSFKLLF